MFNKCVVNIIASYYYTNELTEDNSDELFENIS